MEKTELIELFDTIGYLFPTFKYNLLDPDEQKNMARSWYMILEDYDYHAIEQRLKTYTKKGSGYPPTVGDLVPKDERTGPAIPSYEETKKRLAYYDEMNQAAKKRTEEEEANVQRYKADIERALQLARERQGS